MKEKAAKVISIDTSRYSALVHRILDEYKDIQVNLEGVSYAGSDIEHLKNICTNERLKSAINFGVFKDGKEIFGFHDHPDKFWAAISEIDFVKRAAKHKVIRYRVIPVKPPFWKTFFGLNKATFWFLIVFLLFTF